VDFQTEKPHCQWYDKGLELEMSAIYFKVPTAYKIRMCNIGKVLVGNYHSADFMTREYRKTPNAK
jgi:hypothetical protein